MNTGYIGQRMDNGLVSCLTDRHLGASDGGVLDARGNFVGIPSEALRSWPLFCMVSTRDKNI